MVRPIGEPVWYSWLDWDVGSSGLCPHTTILGELELAAVQQPLTNSQDYCEDNTGKCKLCQPLWVS